MSKSKFATLGKWLTIATVSGGAIYATYLWFFEPAFWLSLGGIALVSMLAAAHLVLLHEEFSAKTFAQQIKTAREFIEPNTRYEIVRVVAFAKLWFRRQFPLIDVELQRLKPSLLRLGLEGVREGYEEGAVRNMMQWHAQQQNEEAVALHGALTSLLNQLPNLAIVAAIAVLTPALIASEGVFTMAQLIPVLAIFACSLIFTSLVIKPLLQKIERQTIANEKAMQLVIEGVILILHKRTPAMIRSTLETMANPQSHSQDYSANQEKVSVFDGAQPFSVSSHPASKHAS